MKKNIAKAMTNAAMRIARKAAGQISLGGTCQPKEPKALKKAAK